MSEENKQEQESYYSRSKPSDYLLPGKLAIGVLLVIRIVVKIISTNSTPQQYSSIPEIDNYTPNSLSLEIIEIASDDSSDKEIDSDRTLLQPGNISYKSHNFQEAVDNYTFAIESKPNFAVAYFNRGVAYYQLEDYHKASDDFTHAILYNPNYLEAYINRCVGFIHLTNYQQAIEDCSQAITIKSDSFLAHFNRGVAREKIGDNLGAIDDYSSAIELKPDDSKAYLNRSKLYSESGNKEAAFEDLMKATDIILEK